MSTRAETPTQHEPVEGVEIINAKIESTMLGIEDHGILTYILHLRFGGGGQGFGTYALDSWSDEHDRRVGTAYGCESIMRILSVVGVEKWEDLKGKHVRIQRESGSWSATIVRIGNIIEDKWFSPRALAAQMETPQ